LKWQQWTRRLNHFALLNWRITMKLLTTLAVAALSLSFGVPAFAQATSSGLTRAEVSAQLVQARADGLLPSNRHAYPPSAEAIAHNREVYAIQHGAQDVAMHTPGTLSAAALVASE
jgi:hypothetical protein